MLSVTAGLLRSGALCQGSAARPQVALTFDDGPHAKWTPLVLDCLDQLKVKATFFVVGRAVARYPDIVREIQDRGHEIGTHLYHHQRPNNSSRVKLRAEIEQSIAQLTDVLAAPVRWLRFPYGDAAGITARELLAKFGVRPVYWTVSAQDSTARNTQAIVDRVAAAIRPGAIILMHDCLSEQDTGLPSKYNSDRTALLAALPKLGELLKLRGLGATTLSELSSQITY